MCVFFGALPKQQLIIGIACTAESQPFIWGKYYSAYISLIRRCIFSLNLSNTYTQHLIIICEHYNCSPNQIANKMACKLLDSSSFGHYTRTDNSHCSLVKAELVLQDLQRKSKALITLCSFMVALGHKAQRNLLR